MGKKILNRSMENWLYDHFSSMTNKELADHLNKELRKENAKQEKELIEILKKITHPDTRKAVLNSLEQLQRFKDIDESFIRHVAKRLKCPPKSPQHISDCNRQKAITTKRKIWQERAEYTDSLMSWFRSFRVREVKYFKARNEHDIRTMRSSINIWNKAEGELRDMSLTSRADKEILVIRVEAKPYRSFN